MTITLGRMVGVGVAALLLTAVPGCGSLGDDPKAIEPLNYAEVSTTTLPDEGGACKNLLNLRYHIHNGIAPSTTTYSSSKRGWTQEARTSGDDVIELDDNRFRRGEFVPQTSPYSCYAAALATVWSAHDHDTRTTEGDIIEISRTSCGIGISHPVTLLELMSVINTKVTNHGYDYVQTNSADAYSAVLNGQVSTMTCRQFPIFDSPIGLHMEHSEGCSSAGIHLGLSTALLAHGLASVHMPLLMLPRMNVEAAWPNPKLTGNLYAPILWSTDGHDSGGIYPIASTSNLVAHALQMHYLLIGLHDNEQGHVVVVTGLRYLPAGYIDVSQRRRVMQLSEDTQILELRLLDPSQVADPQRWVKVTGQEFFNKVDFILAIDLPKAS